MISEGEKEEIRTLLKLARKRSLNFGICMGEEPVETVFVLHRRTKPIALARQAKADGTTPKTAKGRMEVEGRVVKLCCEGKIPTGLTRNLKKYLKILELKMTVELVEQVADLPEEDEDEPAVIAPTEPSITREQSRFEALLKKMGPRIRKMEKSDHPKALKIAAIRDLAVRRAESGDYRTANKALVSLAPHL